MATREQVKALAERNAAQLAEMVATARAKGGLYRGRTADEWQSALERFCEAQGLVGTWSSAVLSVGPL